ncbi:MAG: hypothetical protein ACI9TH_000532 [Kiritimatiellia bacterium]|jgi:hypothetical protein
MMRSFALRKPRSDDRNDFLKAFLSSERILWLLFVCSTSFGHALPHLDLTREPLITFEQAPGDQAYLKLMLQQRFPGIAFTPQHPGQVGVQLIWTNQWGYPDAIVLSGGTNAMVAHVGPMAETDPDAEEASKRLMHQSMKHELPYVDLYRTSSLLNNDVQASPLLNADYTLTPYGEFVTAQLIMHMLGFHTQGIEWTGTVNKGEVQIEEIAQRPLRPPEGSVLHRDMLMKQPRLRIDGLKPGTYALFNRDKEVARGSAIEWLRGIRVIDSPAHLSPGDDPASPDFSKGLRLRFQKLN